VAEPVGVRLTGQSGGLPLHLARLWLCTVSGSPATWKQIQVA